jgi:hypothetical protein
MDPTSKNKENMKQNPERHHRRSMRLRDYNYSEEGAYSVTICTRNRECLLSKIDSDVVGAGLAPALNDEEPASIIKLTKAGEIAKKNWLDIPERYSCCQQIEMSGFVANDMSALSVL